MAEDLMDFSQTENKENSFQADDDDNVIRPVPGLVNSPVIVNSILKQSTKDNLIQLYTPVQKPVRALNRKVRFGSDRLLETPTAKKSAVCKSPLVEPSTTSVQGNSVEEEEDSEAWIDRTSILTKQDHQEYIQFAGEILEDIITMLPIRDDCDISSTSSDSGIGEAPVEGTDLGTCQTEVLSQTEGPIEGSDQGPSHHEQQNDSQPSKAVSPEVSDPVAKLFLEVDSLLNAFKPATADSAEAKENKIPEDTSKPSDMALPVTEHVIESEAGETIVKPVTPSKLSEPALAVTEHVIQTDAVEAIATSVTPSKLSEPVTLLTKQDDKSERMTPEKSLDLIKEDMRETSRNDEVGLKTVDEEQKTAQTKMTEYSDEEFMSAGEEMEVDEPVTPVKRQEAAPSPEPFTDAMEEMEVDEDPTPTAPLNPELSKPHAEAQFEVMSDSPAKSPPKIAYSLDLDNLDSMNPFASKASIMNSPDVAGKAPHPATASASKTVEDKPPKENTETPSVAEVNAKAVVDANKDTEIEEPLKDTASKANLSVKGAIEYKGAEKVVEDEKTPDSPADDTKETDGQSKEMETPITSDSVKEEPTETASQDLEQQASPERIPPKVGYNLDFLDNLEEMNPFATKQSLMNSPDMKAGKAATDNKAADATKTVDSAKDETGKGTDANTIKKSDSHKAADIKKIEGSRVEHESVDSGNGQQTHATDVDEIDPFKSTKQIVNSPDAKKINVAVYENDVDPFQPKTQIVNSPDKQTCKEAKPSEHEGEEPAENRITSEMVVDDDTLPITKQNDNDMKSQIDDLNSHDPFAPKKQIMNTPDKKESKGKSTDILEEIDPFKPKKQMANSPISKQQDVELAAETFEDADPFKPKKQMANSPVSKLQGVELAVETLEEADPFKPRTQMVNSPVSNKSAAEEKCGVEDSQKSITTSDEKVTEEEKANPDMNTFDDLDPFKQKKQMANSPVGKAANAASQPVYNFDDIDPFTSRNQMVISPIGKEPVIESLDDVSFEDIDPFKPKKQMANSPSAQTTNATERPVTDFEDIDPFKPTQQMANSPVVMKADTDQPLPENLDDLDPFKPRQQMANSPAVGKKSDTSEKPADHFDDIDPFKPKKQMANSPIGKSSDILEKPSDIADDADPFKPRMQMAISPVGKTSDHAQQPVDAFGDEDPFKPKKQMANSPKGKNSDVPKAETIDAFEDLDPFKSKNKVPNSPAKCEDVLAELNPFDTKSKVGNSPDAKAATDGACNIPSISDAAEGEEDEVIEVQSVTRRGETPDGAKVVEFDDLGIDDAQFVPASQVFNDPNVWEMLESYGSSAPTTDSESTLSRMSLYVKFDPLVDAAPVPRRISIRPSQLEKMKEFGLDDTLLLLGTPPKKRRQSVNFLKMTPTHTRGTPTERRPVPVPTAEAGVAQPGPIDLMMACSPEGHPQDQTKSVAAVPPVHGLMAEADTEEGGLFQELKYTDRDLRRIRNSLQMELQGQLLAKEKDWSLKEKEWQRQEQAWKKREEQWREGYKKLEEDKKEMSVCCNLYEKTIQELSEMLKKEKTEKKEKEDQTQSVLEDLSSLEKAFSDLHKRYEKAREIIDVIHKNEEKMKKNLETVRESEKKSKKEAEEKVAKYAAENAKLKQAQQDAENLKDSQNKVHNVKLQNLQKNLNQKIEENKELTSLCEDLLNKVPQ